MKQANEDLKQAQNTLEPEFICSISEEEQQRGQSIRYKADASDEEYSCDDDHDPDALKCCAAMAKRFRTEKLSSSQGDREEEEEAADAESQASETTEHGIELHKNKGLYVEMVVSKENFLE